MSKLNTYEGVFIPTTLNVLSILIYLRFGFIVGEAGVLGSLVLLLLSYTINLLTTMSLSAIATNGVVKGGGAYFMISRSLGPEFGGSIGLVFYIGQVLNAGLNIVGFADPLMNSFGQENGSVLPDSRWYIFGYETLLLLVCTGICLVGPELFARSSKMLFIILLVATLAVPASVLFVKPFYVSEFDAWYTGPSWETLKGNWMPSSSFGGSLFGIFFSATAGILAGASMSGDLSDPSRAIPRGTLAGLLLTFLMYALVIIALGLSVSRSLLVWDLDVICTIDAFPALVVLGEFATSIFSALMGVFGAAKLLEAIAQDNVMPLMGSFKGTNASIIATYVLTQLTILLDVDQIAVYITMALLMTFVVLNFACFLLKSASAPNFRPSFRYFNTATALTGFIVCIVAMLTADVFAALVILLVGIVIFVVIHSYTAPKPWGDVSQSIIYHQVRKYLLKLKQDHVKYWRPQILLYVDDPRSGWQLIRFCNYLKKGGLFILGHVIITSGKSFRHEAIEISRQRTAWEKIRDMHKIKAFFQIVASPSMVWGARNVFLGSGLGGMRPNISVLGFYDENESGQNRTFTQVDIQSLPTDHMRKEKHLKLSQWIQVIEDLLSMGSNVCVCRGFMDADLPAPASLWNWSSYHQYGQECEGKYIDLYPIQMKAQLQDSADRNQNGTSINFDTYTLILQLGSILHSVKAWSTTHTLRVIAFVECQTEIERETGRINELLETLRIRAEVIVSSLDIDNFVYDVIVKGHEDVNGFVKEALSSSSWYKRLCEARESGTEMKTDHKQYLVPQVGRMRRRTFSSLQGLGVAHSMQSTHWPRSDLQAMAKTSGRYDESSDESSSSEDEDRFSHPQSFSRYRDDPLDDNVNSDVISETMNEGARHNETAETGPSFQDEPMDASELSSRPEPRDRSRTPTNDKVLHFNDLPASAQHLILNCLMKRVSKDATALFTNLPAPALGTYEDENASQKYYHLLHLLCDGLPPTSLVHAQSMTVTTDL